MAWFVKRKKHLGEILIEKKLATWTDIHSALKTQHELKERANVDKKLGDILREREIIDIVDVNEAMEDQKKTGRSIFKRVIYALFNPK